MNAARPPVPLLPERRGRRGLFTQWSDRLLLAATAGGLAIGAMLRLAGLPVAAYSVWAAASTMALVPAGWWVIDADRHRRLGVDVIALLALVGTLVVGEYLAGAVIAVMLASGRTLEAWAAGRARRELRLLSERAPRTAHRREKDGLVDVDVEAVAVGEPYLTSRDGFWLESDRMPGVVAGGW